MSMTAMLEELTDLRERNETLALDLHDASIRVDENRTVAARYLRKLGIALVELYETHARVEELETALEVERMIKKSLYTLIDNLTSSFTALNPTEDQDEL